MTEGLNWWDTSMAQGCGFGGCLGRDEAEPRSGAPGPGSRRGLSPATATSGAGSEVRWKDAGAWCSCSHLLLAGVSSSVLHIMGQVDFSLASVQAGLRAPEIQGPRSHMQPVLSHPCYLFSP